MDPELRKLLVAAHAAGASDDDLGKLIDRWHADHAPAVDGQQFRPGDEPKPPRDISAQLQAQYNAQQARSQLPDYMQPMPTLSQVGRRAGEELINAVEGIPGTRAVLAKARSMGRGEPYAQAYDEVGSLTGELPKSHQIIGKAVGSLATLPLLPASPVTAGAVLGAADQALSGQPGLSLPQRAVNTVAGSVIGGLGGKIADMGVTAGRAIAGKSLGRTALDMRAATKLADRANYGAAEAEGQAAAQAPTPAVVTQAFSEPDIAPYVSAVKSSRQFANADDATVLREAYKLLSEREGRLQDVVDNNDFKAGTSLQKGDVKLAKQQMLNASTSMMPSFPNAVAQHAQAMGERDAFRQGADVARRVFRGAPVAGRKLETQSPEAFEDAMTSATPGQRTAAAQGIIGRLKQAPKVAHFHGIPIPILPGRAVLAAPDLVRATGAPDQGMIDLLTRLGVLGGNAAAGGPP